MKWSNAQAQVGFKAAVPELGKALADVKRLREALTGICNVLGTGACSQSNCEGCRYEMAEAAAIARAALEDRAA